PRPDDAQPPRAARPPAAGGGAGSPTDLPDLLGLHDRTPQRAGVGLLPARRAVQGDARAPAARRDQARAAPCEVGGSSQVTEAPPLVRRRRIRGASAVLLPFDRSGRPDLDGLRAHAERTIAAGLTPALNM